jgi:hypothetical protein
MSSVWIWGARVLLGLDKKTPRIHGPAETYAVRSFTSMSRGRRMIAAFRNEVWRHRFGWRPYGTVTTERAYEKRFWVLTKHAKPVMEAISELWAWKASWPLQRRPTLQTGTVHERWTEIIIKGIW